MIFFFILKFIFTMNAILWVVYLKNSLFIPNHQEKLHNIASFPRQYCHSSIFLLSIFPYEIPLWLFIFYTKMEWKGQIKYLLGRNFAVRGEKVLQEPLRTAQAIHVVFWLMLTVRWEMVKLYNDSLPQLPSISKPHPPP